MAKKESKQVEVVEQTAETPEVVKTSEITHSAYSMIQNPDESYSVVKIGFNPTDNVVSPVIEVLETNTDKFIVQERLSILLLEMEIS